MIRELIVHRETRRRIHTNICFVRVRLWDTTNFLFRLCYLIIFAKNDHLASQGKPLDVWSRIRLHFDRFLVFLGFLEFLEKLILFYIWVFQYYQWMSLTKFVISHKDRHGMSTWTFSLSLGLQSAAVIGSTCSVTTNTYRQTAFLSRTLKYWRYYRMSEDILKYV